MDNVVSLDEWKAKKLGPQFEQVRRTIWHPSMGDKTPEQYWAEKDAKEGKRD